MALCVLAARNSPLEWLCLRKASRSYRPSDSGDRRGRRAGRDISVSAGAMSGHGASTSLVSVTWPVSRQLIGHITAARTTATNVFPFRCCLSSLLRSPRVSTESARTPGLSGSTYPCCPSQSLVCKSWCEWGSEPSIPRSSSPPGKAG